MYKFLFFLSLFLTLFSCKQNDGQKILPPSTGRFNELLVVIPQSDWDGDIGFALKEVLTREVLGLPQPEPQFSIIRIEPKLYNGLLERTRNVLLVNIDSNLNFKIDKNTHASPQVIIQINGNKEEIIENIKENADKIIASFKNSDMASLRTKPAFPIISTSNITFFLKQKFEFNIPNNFKKINDSNDFLWYRNETYNPGVDINGSMNLIAYSLPLDYSFDQVKDSIVSIRDMIGKKNIPGPLKDTYLITEAAYTPHVFDIKIGNYQAYKILGKWEIKDYFMAGPFVSYFVNDKLHNRLIVVEGFVYAPSVNKRDYMFELEAIIGTLKID